MNVQTELNSNVSINKVDADQLLNLDLEREEIAKLELEAKQVSRCKVKTINFPHLNYKINADSIQTDISLEESTLIHRSACWWVDWTLSANSWTSYEANMLSA